MGKNLGIGLLTLVLLSLVGVWTFSKFAVDSPIEIELIDQKPETLTGVTFTGIPQDKQLSKNFEQMEELKKANPNSSIHTIYEVEPAGKLDTMILFVGINIISNSDDLEVRTFEENRFLLSKIIGSSWTMPSPLSVQDKMKAYASENDLQLSGVFIDKIISDREVHVIAPVK